MECEHVDPIALQRKARETFLTARTREEAKFNNWKKALLTCSEEEILSKLDFNPNEITLQSLIPEWYVDIPNRDRAHEQWVEANKAIDKVNALVDSYNRKGAELLAEFNRMNGA